MPLHLLHLQSDPLAELCQAVRAAGVAAVRTAAKGQAGGRVVSLAAVLVAMAALWAAVCRMSHP